MKLIECVPNVSEGRDKKAVELLLESVTATPGVTLLDLSSDANHNRSVISFLGSPEAVLRAAFSLASRAVQLIDLTRHEGEHPRMGAIDVIPFIPVRDAAMEDCIELSKQLGQMLWNELRLPVYLYERSACAPHRENLAKVREGQFEGLARKMLRPEWAPDFGDPAPHPTAGAVAVGARMPLIAFNINLMTDRLDIAKSIAKIIRQSSGGLPYVKSIGVKLEAEHMAQVSINMTDYTRMPLYRVLELVKAEARRYGVSVAACEIVGLAPSRALIDSAMYYLQLETFVPEHQVLENHVHG